ncbi:MAG: sodium:alanine symporter family protein [Pseudomonadota bacterium]
MLEQLHALVRTLVFGLNDVVWGWPVALPAIVVLLVGTGLVTTLRLTVVQVRLFRHGLQVVRGRFDDPSHEGDLSHFQALTTALSATVGIGNIAGVATAIHYGGPGALFWMWVTAVFGMALKYTECTLALRHRSVLPDGSVAGGPMYSIERGLGPRFKPLAIGFAVFTVISSFGSGNAVQSFTVADQLRQDLNLPTWVTGLVMASLVAAVILGGVRRIGRVTSKLVPVMAALYVSSSLLVLALHADRLVPAIIEIVTAAFQPAAQVGGFAGGGFVFMLTWGVKRGLFSNESGQGSAPIAHSAARTDEPVREGVVALLGPFIDTLVICTMTGLVIVCTGVWHGKQVQRIALTTQASVRALVAGARVQPDGVLRVEDLAEGRFDVVHGVPQGFALVYNHGLIDDVKLVLDDGQALEGKLEVKAGDLAGARWTSIDGRGMQAQVAVEGLALQNGSPLTAWGFKQGLSRLGFGWGHLLVTLAVFLFGLSTAISWSYYGDRAVFYLVGPRWVLPYRVVFCGMHFLGAVFALEVVWAFGDVALGLMTIPNLLSILLLTGQVRSMTHAYQAAGKTLPPRQA